jgi:phage virion morphogenesis protein
MTGARIEATLDDGMIRAAFQRVEKLTGDFRPLLKRVGVGLVKTTQERFVTATDPAGAAWKGLNPAYAAFKRGPGILREKAMRGGLMGSVTFQVQGPRQVAIGSNKIYAAIHQFGGVIRPVHGRSLVFKLGKRVVHARRVTIPARPYLGIGEADKQMIMDQYAFTMQELLRGA